MPLRDRLERWLGLGVALTPRAVQVGGRDPRLERRPLRSTPGARLRVFSDGSGPAHRAIGACLLAGAEVEIVPTGGPPAVTLDGAPLEGDALLRHLRAIRGAAR